MALDIVCSGFLFRFPVGGHTWHHLQYLVGLNRLGHRVTYCEDFGWTRSCYDQVANCMSDDPTAGIDYMLDVFDRVGLRMPWCYLAENGTEHGMTRHELAQRCRSADLYLNLSNINSIPEAQHCRRRALVDTDPVFTQIGAQGTSDDFAAYDVLLTYGENVHGPRCTMPTRAHHWLPTRQPLVLDLWPVTPPDPTRPVTTVTSWAAMEVREYEGRVFGNKDIEFRAYLDLPRAVASPMLVALNGPDEAKAMLATHGWRVIDPASIARDPWMYQAFLRDSRAEFSVAKHGYVSTRCGWFSDRSAGYLASGRPVVVQDTGFSDFLPCGRGLVPFRTPDEAIAAVDDVCANLELHAGHARRIAEECFDHRSVLERMLEACV